MRADRRDSISDVRQCTAPPSPADIDYPERKLKIAISPNDPAALSPIRDPRACAQSSMIGFLGAAFCKAGKSHTLPNIWTAMMASTASSFWRRDRPPTCNRWRRSTSIKHGLKPAALIALKTTGQQYNGTAIEAPCGSASALRLRTIAALAEQIGRHRPMPGRLMSESPPETLPRRLRRNQSAEQVAKTVIPMFVWNEIQHYLCFLPASFGMGQFAIAEPQSLSLCSS